MWSCSLLQPYSLLIFPCSLYSNHGDYFSSLLNQTLFLGFLFHLHARKAYPCKVYTSVVFIMFTLVSPIVKFRTSSSSCEGTSYLVAGTLFPSNQSSAFCLYAFAYYGLSYKWKQTIWGLLWLTSFTCSVFKVCPCCTVYHHFITFYCWIDTLLYSYTVFCLFTH